MSSRCLDVKHTHRYPFITVNHSETRIPKLPRKGVTHSSVPEAHQLYNDMHTTRECLAHDDDLGFNSQIPEILLELKTRVIPGGYIWILVVRHFVF
jgi:hypothetical protein